LGSHGAGISPALGCGGGPASPDSFRLPLGQVDVEAHKSGANALALRTRPSLCFLRSIPHTGDSTGASTAALRLLLPSLMGIDQVRPRGRNSHVLILPVVISSRVMRPNDSRMHLALGACASAAALVDALRLEPRPPRHRSHHFIRGLRNQQTFENCAEQRPAHGPINAI